MSTYSHREAQADTQSFTHDREVAWLRRNQRLGELFLVTYVGAWTLAIFGAVILLALFGAPEPVSEAGPEARPSHGFAGLAP